MGPSLRDQPVKSFIAALQAAGLGGDGFPARWAGLRDDGPLGQRLVTKVGRGNTGKNWTKPCAFPMILWRQDDSNIRIPESVNKLLVTMVVRYANSYIDRLFAERDLISLYQVISVIGKERALPEEFWLFCRVYEWAPSRSGVWQYYEGLSDDDFEHMAGALERFGLGEIAEKYRLGKETWNGPDRAADLDSWQEANEHQIHDSVFRLIAARKELLKNGS